MVKAQSDSKFFINAKIERIDTIDYYVVIKAISKNKGRVTILSSTDVKSPFSEKSKDSCSVKVGCSYNFIVQTMGKIKNGSDSYLFVSLRKFDYNGKSFLEAGELPYEALNMYKSSLAF